MKPLFEERSKPAFTEAEARKVYVDTRGEAQVLKDRLRNPEEKVWHC